jgi:NAD-dependent SIR2 family protein deacetylase
VPLEPFSATTNVDELHRRIGLKDLSDIRAPLYRYAGKFDAFLPPLRFV